MDGRQVPVDGDPQALVAAQHAVREAREAAARAGQRAAQMAALRERLRGMREENHFSEQVARTVRRGYGPPAAGGPR